MVDAAEGYGDVGGGVGSTSTRTRTKLEGLLGAGAIGEQQGVCLGVSQVDAAGVRSEIYEEVQGGRGEVGCGRV